MDSKEKPTEIEKRLLLALAHHPKHTASYTELAAMISLDPSSPTDRLKLDRIFDDFTLSGWADFRDGSLFRTDTISRIYDLTSQGRDYLIRESLI